MQYLMRLPRSASHPAGSSLQVTISQARETYISTRHDYIVNKCVNPAILNFNELLDDKSPGGEEEGRRARCDKLLVMLQGILALMQSERMLLDHLFPKSSANSLLSIFSTPVNHVEELLNSQIAYIKKSLASQTFYALELYQTLLHVQSDWEEITNELDCDPPVVRLVSETLNSLRNPCLRSFPEALVDIRVAQSSGKGETSSIADVTYRTVHYLSTLPAYEHIVIDLLSSLGDRNWLMGAVTASQRQNDGDSILQHFATDMLSALLEQLESRGRGMRRLVSAIFLLNNHVDVLGTGGENVLNRGFRDARAKFMEVWQELVSLLAESTNAGGAVARLTGASGDKQQVKDSLSNFFVKLDDLEAMSKQHVLSRLDPDLRERLVQDVRNLVVPAFSSYAGRHAKQVEKCE
ncbi:hypothetical protein QFC22_003034 [Naganishia vaughanmartiniae]|uniref:Uncharacterized protein n=1 Tax=Naganishia vaughanmartiniae TaxID=1424756 RepID=A0ACC2X9Q5_9TREE|nr:hypothetical protein QFC22_003034 [Naganishia vaughanmartiniae]